MKNGVKLVFYSIEFLFFFFDPRIKIGIIIGLLVLSYPGRDYRYSEYKNRCYPVIFSFFTYMR